MSLLTSPTRQFALTIVVRVHRERLPKLRAVLDRIRLETIQLMNGHLTRSSMQFDSMTTIHYARWVLIDRHRAFMSGPQLVLSTNYDGPVGDNNCSEDAARRRHIAELIEHGREALDEIYRCCIGYEAEGDDPLAIGESLMRYLTDPAHVYPASTFYIGAPGRSRDQIFAEAELRRRVEQIIDDKQKGEPWCPVDSVAMRREIRDALGEEIPSFPPQPSVLEGPQWSLKQLGVALLILIEIGLIANVQYLLRWIWPQAPWWAVTLGVIGAVFLGAAVVYHYVKWILPEPGRLLRGVFVAFLILVGVIAALLDSWDRVLTASWQVHLGISAAAFVAMTPWKNWKASLLLLIFLAVGAVSAGSYHQTLPDWEMWSYCFMLLTVAVAIPTAAALYGYRRASEHLRHLETNDPPFDMYYSESEQQQHKRSSIDENLFFQNQLSNIAVLKPGAFRASLLHGVFYALQLLAPTVYNKGKLGDIPTIHFARWVLSDGGRRVLFFSNFDSSWQSYLGDFIDKASSGLTAVWSNTVGYPRTRDLVYAGSEDADRFKAWARHIQVPTQVWYSAYPGLSIRNINDNTMVRRGLADPSEVDGQVWLDALHGRQS